MVRNCAAQRGDACQRCGFQPPFGTTSGGSHTPQSGATAVSISPASGSAGRSSASVGAAHHQDRPWGAHGPSKAQQQAAQQSKAQQEAAQQASSGEDAAPAQEAVGAQLTIWSRPQDPLGGDRQQLRRELWQQRLQALLRRVQDSSPSSGLWRRRCTCPRSKTRRPSLVDVLRER